MPSIGSALKCSVCFIVFAGVVYLTGGMSNGASFNSTGFLEGACQHTAILDERYGPDRIYRGVAHQPSSRTQT
jgi:hypothetical protein